MDRQLTPTEQRQVRVLLAEVDRGVLLGARVTQQRERGYVRDTDLRAFRGRLERFERLPCPPETQSRKDDCLRQTRLVLLGAEAATKRG